MFVRSRVVALSLGDRILIAQSQLEEMPILTADSKIAQYGVDVTW